jgi:hypothetical protein
MLFPLVPAPDQVEAKLQRGLSNRIPAFAGMSG